MQDNERETDSRREFLKHVLAGTATATVLMVFGGGKSLANLTSEKAADLTSRGLAFGENNGHDYAFVVDIKKCIGCGNCVRACKRENAVPPAVFRTWVERYVMTGEGVYVDSPNGALEGFEEVNAKLSAEATKAMFVPKLCNHCGDPPCVQVCPVGATFKTAEGFVLIDEEHCIGCAYCVQACPYGVRFINPVKMKADKCDWCYHRVKAGKLPACVTVCPTKTRLFGDLNDPDNEVTKIFQKDKWMVLKPHMHTHPTCFYLGLPREVV